MSRRALRGQYKMALRHSGGGGRRGKNKKTKVALVFDEDARREYLTGFKKRKDARRKRAKEEFDNRVKNEMKRIKAKKKQWLEERMVHIPKVPDLDDLETEQKVIEHPGHTVTVTTIADLDLTDRGGRGLGTNKIDYAEEDTTVKPPTNNSDSEEEKDPEESPSEQRTGKNPKKWKFKAPVMSGSKKHLKKRPHHKIDARSKVKFKHKKGGKLTKKQRRCAKGQTKD
ncbi:nucleolar protein 12-like [Branchiostoma floridae]|uniref:Nucleolar protein 12 n=2 Tax=Branchiostoma floridae TaxID=7739 RepID=A0A9J7N6Y5_BRAFL|nr:nucleolar protein 12-like [Branchiostoma floridae]